MRWVRVLLFVAVAASLSIGAGAAQASGVWAQESPPNPFPPFNDMSGVSCAAPNACEAVAEAFEAGWNGLTWTQQDVPTLVTAIYCARADACTAVGGDTAARWDGTSWTTQYPVTPAPLVAVSCPTVSFCLAVGGDVAESWNGASWSLEPIVPGGSNTQLSAVSCTSPFACTAVGTTLSSSLENVPLIERWNGVGWSLQSGPSPIGVSLSGLDGVSCTSPRQCMAVGTAAVASGVTEGWAERWNGTTWTIVNVPNPPGVGGPPNNDLGAVSCHTEHFCIAVGDRFFGNSQSYALRWDGATWSSLPAPFGDSQTSVVAPGGVSCPTLHRCQVVGTNVSVGTQQSFALAAEYRG